MPPSKRLQPALPDAPAQTMLGLILEPAIAIHRGEHSSSSAEVSSPSPAPRPPDAPKDLGTCPSCRENRGWTAQHVPVGPYRAAWGFQPRRRRPSPSDRPRERPEGTRREPATAIRPAPIPIRTREEPHRQQETRTEGARGLVRRLAVPIAPHPGSGKGYVTRLGCRRVSAQ